LDEQTLGRFASRPALNGDIDVHTVISIMIYVPVALKPVRWVGTSLDDLRSFPAPVRRDIGQALFAAQQGEMDPAAKPLKGFGGASVLEIVASYKGDAWRAVYSVRFQDAIYVLHAFQKKSTRGISTPAREVELIQKRLTDAARDHKERQREK
jgi:phage-related protein